MSAQTITVYIDLEQLAAQQENNYSLYLAKKVNDHFTVIWQSLGPVAMVNKPSYEYQNTFQIAVPAYQVNYGTIDDVQGSVTFSAAGKPVTMNLGQAVDLSQGGIFGQPTNTGTPGNLTVTNNLAANPHEILSDSQGNPIFVNTMSGMNIGQAVLTPIDQYQLWFGSLVETGTIIANNVSNPGTVTFNGTDNQTISYTKDGTWISGALPPSKLALAPEVKASANLMIVAGTFTTALGIVATTYILNKLITKFGTLKPKSITTQVGSTLMTVEFENTQLDSSLVSLDKYEQAVNNALDAAAEDPKSGIRPHSWILSEPAVQMHF